VRWKKEEGGLLAQRITSAGVRQACGIARRQPSKGASTACGGEEGESRRETGIRHLIVAPRPMPAAPLDVRRRYLTAAPRPLSVAPIDVRRRNLVVVPRPLPAAPLVLRRRYFVVVPRPLPVVTQRCRSRRRTTRQMYSGKVALAAMYLRRI
jgi:hypothetical protein